MCTFARSIIYRYFYYKQRELSRSLGVFADPCRRGGGFSALKLAVAAGARVHIRHETYMYATWNVWLEDRLGTRVLNTTTLAGSPHIFSHVGIWSQQHARSVWRSQVNVNMMLINEIIVAKLVPPQRYECARHSESMSSYILRSFQFARSKCITRRKLNYVKTWYECVV